MPHRHAPWFSDGGKSFPEAVFEENSHRDIKYKRREVKCGFSPLTVSKRGKRREWSFGRHIFISYNETMKFHYPHAPEMGSKTPRGAREACP